MLITSFTIVDCKLFFRPFVLTFQAMSYAKLAGLQPIYGLCKQTILIAINRSYDIDVFYSKHFANIFMLIDLKASPYLHSLVSSNSNFYCKADSGFLPLFVYAIFGSSRQLAVGPVALVSLLVSNVLGGIVNSSEELYTELAILLALMVGILECVMGLLR